MRYTVYITVNRPNGTDYDMNTRDYVGLDSLKEGVKAIVALATKECLEESTFPPSSIILTVVPH